MFESFLIVFRESLEVALIVGIILAFLRRTSRWHLVHTVSLGIIAGVGASVALGYLFITFFTSFMEKHEALFEGVLMLGAALLLTSMIFWFLKQQSMRQHIEGKIEQYHERWSRMGLFFVVMLLLLREGVETVIFLSTLFFSETASIYHVYGAFSGFFLAIGLGYLIFVVEKKLPIRSFFLTTNILLILFAAGLVAHGFHELGEAGVVPFIVEEVYNMNHILNEKGAAGSVLKGLFGYNGNPSLIEMLVYGGYLAAVAVAFNIKKRKTLQATNKIS